MKMDCDVLVVGGGPAGLVTSMLLTKKGLSVVIIEKNDHVGGPFSKFDITEGNRIKSILNELNVYPRKISSKSEWISKNNIFTLDSVIKDLYFKRGNTPKSIENNLFIRLQEKKDLIKFIFNSEIDSMKIRENKIEKIIVKNTTISPKHVIFADGGHLNIGQKIELESKILATFEGFGAVIPSDESNLIPHAKIYLDSKIAPGGYVYTGSVDKELFACVVIDSLFSETTDLKKNLKEFLKTNFGKMDISNYFTGKGICGLKNAMQENVFFVGGSAFFHDPFFGYGLNYAIESAYFAAQTIINRNKEIYKSYCTKVQDEIFNTFFTRQIWRKANDDFFLRLIKSLNEEITTEDPEILQIVKFFKG